MGQNQELFGKWENHFESLASESVDLIYTDPPYEMNYVSNIPGDSTWCNSGKSESRFERPIMGDSKTDRNDWISFFKECCRILKPNSYLVIHVNMPLFAKVHPIIENADSLTYKGTIAWNKRFAIGGDCYGAMKRDWEPIVYYAKGKPHLNSIKVERNKEMQLRKRISEIADWDFMLKNEEKWGHPTQKPIELAKQMISLMTDCEDTVLDPFAGSGTIPMAAKELGRKYIAIECDKEFFNLMSKRLNGDVKPIRDAVKVKHEKNKE